MNGATLTAFRKALNCSAISASLVPDSQGDSSTINRIVLNSTVDQHDAVRTIAKAFRLTNIRIFGIIFDDSTVPPGEIKADYYNGYNPHGWVPLDYTRVFSLSSWDDLTRLVKKNDTGTLNSENNPPPIPAEDTRQQKAVVRVLSFWQGMARTDLKENVAPLLAKSLKFNDYDSASAQVFIDRQWIDLVKWPIRTYNPSGIFSTCDDNGCDVHGIVAWKHSSGDNTVRGRAIFDMHLDRQFDIAIIKWRQTNSAQ